MQRKVRTGLGLVFGALALGLRPDPVVAPSAWGAQHFVVPDGPYAGQTWDPEVTPFWREPLDCLSLEHPANHVSIRKSAQVGATAIGICWTLYLATVSPIALLTVFPTESLAKDWVREKLAPAIEKCIEARGKIADQKSRSTEGSTVLFKRFTGGGFDAVTGASSAPGLRARTVRALYAEEIDDWPEDLDGQGDPMEMATARYNSFLALGTWKHADISTPTIEGRSRIDKAYEAGDQRVWEMACPHCGAYQQLVFEQLRFERDAPHRAHYVCVESGCVIEHSAKRRMLTGGRWRATAPGPGRQPSFHIDVLSSPFVTWDQVAAKYLGAGDDPEALKTFTNLWLGRSWKVKGESPEADLLYERRRGGYQRNTLPEGVLFLTLGADVQGDRIELEIVGWGIGKRRWSIDYRVLTGPTQEFGVWSQLGAVLAETWHDSRGNARQIEVACVDSGFRPEMVYQFCHGRPNAVPIKGSGREGAAIIVPGQSQSFTMRGRAKKGTVRVWMVGTWQIKASLYAALAIDKTAESPDPLGYCQFPEDYARDYFDQLTAETLVEKPTKAGRVTLEWVKAARAPNEALDCAVYARAAAEHPAMRYSGLKPMGLMTPADWQALAAVRGAPPEPDQMDLLTAAMAGGGSPAGGGGAASPRAVAPAGEARREEAGSSRRAEGAGRGMAQGRGVGGGGRGVS